MHPVAALLDRRQRPPDGLGHGRLAGSCATLHRIAVSQKSSPSPSCIKFSYVQKEVGGQIVATLTKGG